MPHFKIVDGGKYKPNTSEQQVPFARKSYANRLLSMP
jgi:hypothetical protein